MRNGLKTILLAVVITFVTPSCASYRNVTFEPCLPKEKITLKERAENYIVEPDGTYNIEFKINSYFKDKQLRFERRFMGF